MSDQSATATPSVAAKTGSGQTVIVECISRTAKGDESGVKQKTDDKSGDLQVVHAEVHMNLEPEDKASLDVEKCDDDDESESTEIEEDQLIVEFEDQAYELSQAYQLEEEYQDMTTQQEAAAVQALTPWEQAEY